MMTPRPGGQHVPADGLAHQERAREVDGDRGIPVATSDRSSAGASLAMPALLTRTSIRPKSATTASTVAVDGVGIGDVAGESAAPGQSGGDLGGARLVEVEHRDRGALRRERRRDGRPDPGCAAGHQGDRAVQSEVEIDCWAWLVSGMSGSPWIEFGSIEDGGGDVDVGNQ